VKDEPLHIAIPTRDFRAGIASIIRLVEVGIGLNPRMEKPLDWNVTLGGFVVQTRTKLLEDLKRKYPDKKDIWLLWLDDDIIIDDATERIVHLIQQAEAYGLSFVSNVRTLMPTKDGSTKGNIFKNDHEVYSNSELNLAGDFELKVHQAGLALAYIKTPLDYKFRWDDKGEDVNFFRDNADKIDLRYCCINNVHYKGIWI
jgi:hypothetical protein